MRPPGRVSAREGDSDLPEGFRNHRRENCEGLRALYPEIHP